MFQIIFLLDIRLNDGVSVTVTVQYVILLMIIILTSPLKTIQCGLDDICGYFLAAFEWCFCHTA